MKGHKIFKIIALLFITAQSFAIDLQVLNYSVTPNPISVGQSYTLSLEIANVADGSGEASESPRIVIDSNGSFTPSQIILESSLGSFPTGWINATAVSGVLIFDLDLSNNPLLPDQSVSFQADFLAGNTSIAPQTITVVASDLSLTDTAPGNNQSAVNVEVVAAATETDLLLRKFVKDGIGGSLINGTTIPFASTYYYSIQVDNLSTIIAENVNVTDNLPIGVEIIGFSSVSNAWNCTWTGFDINSSQQVTCTIPNIAANIINNTDFLYLQVQAKSSGNKFNNASVSSATNDLDTSNNSNNPNSSNITIDTDPSASVDMSITKDIVSGAFVSNLGVLEATQGTQVGYKILVNNTTAGIPANNVIITDVLPTGVELVSHNGLGNFQNNCIYDTGTTTLVCTATSIPLTTADDGVEILVNVTGNINDVVAINTATVSADNDLIDSSASSASFTIISAALPLVDITMTKDALNFDNNVISTINVGESFKYRLVVENFGAEDAPIGSVRVLDTLPPEVSFVLPFNDPPNWTCTILVNQVYCANDTVMVASGGPQIIEIPVTADIEATGVVNTAITSIVVPEVVFDTDLSNDTDQASIDIGSGLSATSLAIDKQALFDGLPVASVSKGATFVYRINITNSGTENASNLQLIDDMPAGITVNNSNGIGWSCSNIGQLYTCDMTTQLASGATTFVDFEVVDNSVATITQIQNNVDVYADNVPLQTVSNILNLTNADLDVNISQNPNPVLENTNFEILVDIVNTGSEPLQTIQVVNTLPTGFNYNTTNEKASNCTQSGSVMTCMVSAPIGIGATETIIMPVTAIAVVDVNTIYTNTTVVSGSNLTASVTTQTTMNVSAAVAPQGDISIVKSASMASVATGELFQYTLAVTNIGSSNVTDVVVIDNLPVGIVLDSISAPNWSCQGTAQILCTQASMAVGVTSTIDINVFAPSTAGTIINSAQVSIAEVDSDSTNNSSQVNVNINSVVAPNNDVSILKTASVSTISVAESFQYTLAVFNSGATVATGLTVTDILPAGVQLDSIDATDWSCTGTTQIQCSLSSLSVGSSSSIVLQVTAPDIVGIISNTANVNMNEIDNDPNNDSSQVNVNVTGATTPLVADLRLQKSASNDELTSGEQMIWTIEVYNNGPDSAEDVVVTDVLPSGFEILTVDTNNGTCTNDNATVTCAIPLISNQELVTITIMGNVILTAGVLDNIASLESATDDSNVSNNSDMASILVNAIQVQQADVSVGISASDDINQGDTVTFNILTKNNGPNSANNTTLNIAVVGILDNVSVAETSDWSCQVAGLVIDCQFNSELMPAGHQSELSLVVETTRVVMQEQNVGVNVIITTSTDDPDMSNNVASTQVNVAGTPTEGEILTAMQSALNGTGSEQVNQAIENVSSYCERKYYTALEGLCADLYGAALSGDGETIKKVMEEITPSEVIGQSSSVAEIATAQFRNVGARLSALRGGGGGGFSSAGLNARYGSGSIPLGMLAYLNQTEDKTDGITNTANDFISPWGFFVNGSISMGERDATGRELGFDFDTFGLTAGFDYRLDAKKVIGIAIGYASFDSKIEDSAKLESTGVTLTGYGSFYVNDNFYVDTRISYGKPSFDQSRQIDFSVGDVQVQRTALGETDANQYSVAMSAGYDFNKNSWNITPNASISYVKTTINGFTETGAGEFNFRFGEQIIESMVWSAGVNLSKAISLKKGVITPQFDFNYNYESLNDSNDIRAWFVMAPDDEVFIIKTDSPDRTYGSAGLGFVYISSNGKQAYINYRSILGLEGFSRGTFNLGARFEF